MTRLRGLEHSYLSLGSSRLLASVQIGVTLAILTSCAWCEESKVAPEQTAWAFRKPVRAALPTVRRQDWVRNPIDSFVLAKLEAGAIDAGPEADRRVLIRRVTFDLLGIPPTPEEVETFAHDTRRDAYERSSIVCSIRPNLANGPPPFGSTWCAMRKPTASRLTMRPTALRFATT